MSAGSVAGLSLAANDFQLFSLPTCFTIDAVALDEKWRILQRQFHPDRFVRAGAVDQRIATQWSARINEAYKRLKNPISRAQYAYQLRADAQRIAVTEKTTDTHLLMEHMEFREGLEAASTLSDLALIAQKITSAKASTLQDCASVLDNEKATADDLIRIQTQVNALPFFDKLELELRQRQALLTH